jgi:hypothetical protein
MTILFTKKNGKYVGVHAKGTGGDDVALLPGLPRITYIETTMPHGISNSTPGFNRMFDLVLHFDRPVPDNCRIQFWRYGRTLHKHVQRRRYVKQFLKIDLLDKPNRGEIPPAVIASKPTMQQIPPLIIPAGATEIRIPWATVQVLKNRVGRPLRSKMRKLVDWSASPSGKKYSPFDSDNHDTKTQWKFSVAKWIQGVGAVQTVYESGETSMNTLVIQSFYLPNPDINVTPVIHTRYTIK